MSSSEKIIFDESAVNRALTRIAHEVIEHNPDETELYMFGIKRRGLPLAKRIAETIAGFSDITVHLTELDITHYRDDITPADKKPSDGISYDGHSIVGKTVILVDDVIYTGRTARAAMDAVISLGRAARIQLAVLIDRGHRELPIRGDYVGKNVPTSRNELIRVKMPETDGCMMVTIVRDD